MKCLLIFGLLGTLFFSQSTLAKDLRMKGAKPAKIRDYPSLASISSNGEFLTHGVILNKKVIMATYIDALPGEIEVRVGSSSWSTGGQIVPLKKIYQTEFVSFLILENELTFGPSVKAAKFTDNSISEEYTKLQMVGWGYPSNEDDERTENLYVQNAPVIDQDDCEEQYAEIFDEVPSYIPLYCVAAPPGYGMFDDDTFPVFKNGQIEAFTLFRDDEATSILLVHAQFVNHEMKMILNSMDGL